VLLSQINSPFIVNMHFAFQDRDTLYLVLDLMEGGDLRYHIGNRVFNEIQCSSILDM
jgi:serine/threonine protein kinase